MQMQSLIDVLADQLADVYGAERQLVDTLPRVAQAAQSRELGEAFENHLGETRQHVSRLEQIFEQADIPRVEEHCEGIEGLIKEGEEAIAAQGDPTARDAALIAAAQRVEHYEIAGYGTAKTLADQLGLNAARDALDDNLGEEGKANVAASSARTASRPRKQRWNALEGADAGAGFRSYLCLENR